jgi:hypothetical protein
VINLPTSDTCSRPLLSSVIKSSHITSYGTLVKQTVSKERYYRLCSTVSGLLYITMANGNSVYKQYLFYFLYCLMNLMVILIVDFRADVLYANMHMYIHSIKL